MTHQKIWLLRARYSRTETFINTAGHLPTGRITNRWEESQTDHILIDRRGHSGILDVRAFCVADCDTDQNLVVAKFSERLAVRKKAAQTFDVKRQSQEAK